MAFSIDTIRNFATSGAVVLNQQGDGIQSAKFHGLRSFFGIGDARQQNAEVIMALHQAIMNDPRFAARDVQAEATRLLCELSPDRAIGITQLKNVIKSLDDLVKNSFEAIDRRISLHLAAIGLPAYAKGHEEEISALVRLHCVSGARGNFAGIDVVGRAQEALRLVDAAVMHAGNDPDLLDVLFTTLNKTLCNFDGTLASEETVNRRLDGFREDLARIDARAQASNAPAAVKSLGLDFLKGLEKPVHPGVIDALDDFALSLPVKAFSGLNAKSSPSDIIRAVHRFAEALSVNVIQYPEGVQPLNGGDEQIPTVKFLARRAIASLPVAVQKNVLAAFSSPNGLKACDYIAYEVSSGHAEDDFNAVNYVITYLQARAGKPVGYPGGLGPRDRPQCDGFSPLALCAYNPDYAISGGASARALRNALFRPHGFDSEIPARSLHAKIDDAARSMINMSFAHEMRKIATGAGGNIFDIDIVRNMKVVLPDGSALPPNGAAARDKLAQLVTGDKSANYATLAPADRVKADVFVALLSQELEKAAQMGVPVALSPDGNVAAFATASMGQTTRSFSISGSPDEGFSIHYDGKFPTRILDYDDGTQFNEIDMESGGFCEYEMEIDLPLDAFDRVASVNWAEYDSVETDRILSDGAKHVNRLTEADNAVAPEFRIGLDVSVGFHIAIAED
jgi:hypothetical protein